MVLMWDGMEMEVILVLASTEFDKLVSPSGMVKEVRPDSLKAPAPMLVTVSGSEMEVREEHFRKASSPMEVMVDGSLTSCSWPQLAKASLLMAVTPSWIVTRSSPDWGKALVKFVTVPGRVISRRALHQRKAESPMV